MRLLRCIAVIGLWSCGSNRAQLQDAPQGGPDSPGQANDASTDAANGGSTIARSGSRLKLTWLVTADGVRVPMESPLAFCDSARGEACTAQSWSNGNRYCSPPGAATTLVYADNACTMPLIQVQISGSPSATYWERMGVGTDASVASLYTLGAVATYPSMIWSITDDAGDCGNAQSLGTGPHLWTFYAATPVASTAFVELTTETDAGSDPLQAIHDESIDGLLWPLDQAYATAASATCQLQDNADSATVASCDSLALTRGYDATTPARLKPIDLTLAPSFVHYDHLLYDSVLGTECGFGAGAGGTSACGPFPTDNVKSLFADVGCTTPVDVVEVTPPELVPVYATLEGEAVYHYHRVEGLHTAQLFWGEAGDCSPYDGNEGEVPPNETFYDVDSTEITPDELASAAIVVDP